MEQKFNESTPLSFLTVGQFIEILKAYEETKPEPLQKSNDRRLVYGLKGIRDLFNVSHATAQRYKDTILKDAISQQGRKIIVDVEKALELFNAPKVKNLK
jgi:hypothetical protein